MRKISNEKKEEEKRERKRKRKEEKEKKTEEKRGKRFGLASWHINHCWLFSAKYCFYIYIKYMICKQS